MKRIIALLLALCLLCLGGCGAAPAEKAEELREEPAPVEKPVEAPELEALLEEIRERSRPGTAGSSLTALELGAKLLDWAMLTGLDEVQIGAATEDFLKPLSNVQRAEFEIQMDSVFSAVERLLGEDAAAQREDIGGTEGSLYPWTGLPTEKLDALFSAVSGMEMTLPEQIPG